MIMARFDFRLFIVSLLATGGLLCPFFCAEPGGVSKAFTSTDPVVVKARELMNSGKFKEAEGLLDAKSKDGEAVALRARSELADILRRTRWEYSLELPELVAKVKKSVPNATEREVAHWAEA